MTEHLKAKWRRLRIFKAPGMFEINYRIISNDQKMRAME